MSERGTLHRAIEAVGNKRAARGAIIAGAGILALGLLTSCGDDDSSETPLNAPTSSSTAIAAPDSTISADSAEPLQCTQVPGEQWLPVPEGVVMGGQTFSVDIEV
jgi:hypothetical protein